MSHRHWKNSSRRPEMKNDRMQMTNEQIHIIQIMKVSNMVFCSERGRVLVHEVVIYRAIELALKRVIDRFNDSISREP